MPLSPGSQRAFTLADVIAALTQKTEAALSPDLSVDNTFTLFQAVPETGSIKDTSNGAGVVCAARTNGTWGGLTTDSWGTNTWGA